MNPTRLLLCTLALAPLAAAQEATPAEPAPPGAAEPSRGIDPAIWMDGVRAAYRDAVVHEHHTIIVTPPHGEASSAVIVTRTSPGEKGPRTWMQLGPFDVLFEPSRVAIVHRHNRKTVLVREGGEGLAPLMDAAPRIPLPQLAWISGAGTAKGSALDELRELGAWFEGLEIREVVVGGDGLAVTAFAQRDGEHPRAQVRVDESNRVVEFVARVRASESPDAWGELRVSSREIEKEPIPEWDAFIAGRERVTSISQLRPAPSQIPVGVTLPSLGFMTRAMEAWDFGAISAGAETQAPGARHLFAFVLYDASKARPRDDGASGYDAVYRAARQMRRDSAVRRTPLVRIHAVPVGVVGVDDFRPDLMEKREKSWSELVAPLGPENGAAHVWSSIGADAIGRFVPESAAVVVLTDASLRILGVIPLDGRAGDTDALANEVMAAAGAE